MQLHRTLSTPLGPLTLYASAGGLTRLAFGGPTDGAGGGKTSEGQALAILEQAATELDEYFARHRRSFSVPIDSAVTRRFFGPTFQGRARTALIDIPYGQLWSYGKLAGAAGNAKAVRAAGNACATNPLPIIIPCHRVVKANAQLGNYLGGQAAKEYLIRLEKEAQLSPVGNQTDTNSV